MKPTTEIPFSCLGFPELQRYAKKKNNSERRKKEKRKMRPICFFSLASRLFGERDNFISFFLGLAFISPVSCRKFESSFHEVGQIHP